MKRFKPIKIKKINLKISIMFIIILLSFNEFRYLTVKVLPKIYSIINDQLNYNNNKLIMDCIETNDLTKEKLNDLIMMNKNKNDEILSFNYNLENTYKILNVISEKIKNNMYSKNFDTQNKNYQKMNDGIVLFYPIGIFLNNIYLNNFGPKIPIKISYYSSMISSLKTKITNYGINNVMIELYLNISIVNNVTIPVLNKDYNNDYSILLAATVEIGKVPTFIGNSIENNSPEINT